MSRKIFVLLCLLVVSAHCISQQEEIDSLKTVLKTDIHDTTRCDIYLHWGEMVYFGFPDSAVAVWKKAQNICEKNLTLKGKDKKLYLMRSANALSNLGTVYHYQGKIELSLEHLYRSLKVCEELNDKAGMPIILGNIGSIYFDQENFPKAMECYEKALKLQELNADKRGIGNALNNIASIYDHQNNPKMALEYLLAALKNYEAVDFKRGVASALHNIAGIYKDQKRFPEAMECYDKTLKIREELSDKAGMAATLNNMAGIKLETGSLNEALSFGNRSLHLSRELAYPSNISYSAGTLKRIFQKQNKYKEAFEMYELEMSMRDSMRNEETQKSTLKKELQYDYEKKEAVADAEHKSELRNQELIATEKNRKQNLIIAFAVVGLLVVLLFTVFVSRSLRITRKQKALIEKQKRLVEEHQKEVIDSIYYARRIQQSLLPTEKYIEKNMKRLQKKSESGE